MEPVAGRKRVAAILAIDMQGYSALAEQDAATAAAAVAALHARVRAAAEARQGRVFSTAGDGLMCEFPAASEAVAAAADMLASNPADARPVRIGVHLGEAFEHEGGDLLGHGVNVAARLEQLARPGTALISRAAGDMVQGKLRARLAPAGRVELAKMDETVDAYVLDPFAKPGRPRMPRRKRMQLLAAGGAAAVLALTALIFMFGALSPRQTALDNPATVDRVAQEVMARLAAESSSDPRDVSLRAVADLAASREPNAEAAFAFLRAGETDQAVTTLERFGADLAQRGVRQEAANAYLRAALIAAFLDPRRALDNARRAVSADPQSKAAIEELVTMTRVLEGDEAARRAAREIIAREREPSPTRAFAYAMIVANSSRYSWDQSAQRALEALNREAPLFPDDTYLQAAAALARGNAAYQRDAGIAELQRHYEEANTLYQRIPGSEWRGQYGLIAVEFYSGDVERIWSLGRTFIAERERQGWPPHPTMLRSNCVVGVLLLGLLEEARPYCLAVADNRRDPVAGWQAKLILDLEERRLHDAERDADALRALMPNLTREQRVFAGEVLDYAAIYLALLRGDLATADRITASKRAALTRRPGGREEEAQTLIFVARIDLAMGRKDRACARLDEAARVYSSYGADRGALFAERQARQAGC